MLLIDAIYICQTGGKKLLDILLTRFEQKCDEEAIVLIDSRIKCYYKKAEHCRIKMEFLENREKCRYEFYRKNKNTFRKVFCLANVPPPIRLNCQVITYFHNVILFDKELQKSFSLKDRLIFNLKRKFVENRFDNSDKWYVQTSHVKRLLQRSEKLSSSDILIFPFFDDKTLITDNNPIEKTDAFFYPAVGLAHKNHLRLLKAWKILYNESGFKNELHITVNRDQNHELLKVIIDLQKQGVPIINHGLIGHNEVTCLYSKCKYVIHPSLGESFGLVLIEALINNCILLAPSLDYVISIVQPDFFFDANDITSIAKTVKMSVNGESAFESKILVKNSLEDLIENICS
jgi:hypothetical protein